MSESDNVALLKRAYAAFNQGDIAALVEMFAQDVDWEWPTLKEFHTRGGVVVVRRFGNSSKCCLPSKSR